MIRVFVEGVGIVAPGLDGWARASAVLAARASYVPGPDVPGPVRLGSVELLPPAERRRAGMTVRLAIAAGTEALAQTGHEPADMAMVFAASGGDGETIHETLAVLATHQREVSPTRFHNSVHNAPSGYWAVATGSRAPSTSLSAFDGSFAQGLLEAAALAIVEDRPVTLVAYDVPYPEPLHAARPILSVFGMAVVLAPRRPEKPLAVWAVAMSDTVSCETRMADPELERLRIGNPAARGLPLLAALALGHAGTVRLAGIDVIVAPP